jgi:hypothetical protein
MLLREQQHAPTSRGGLVVVDRRGKIRRHRAVAGTCFGSGSELGFDPSPMTVDSTADAPKLVPPNANTEDSAIKGSEDEDSMKRAYMVNAPEGEDKELNGWEIVQRKKRVNKRSTFETVKQ